MIDLDGWFEHQLAPLAASAIPAAIGDLVRDVDVDDVVGVGFVTDASATTVTAVAHTRAHLERRTAEAPDDADLHQRLRWTPSMWDLRGSTPSRLRSLVGRRSPLRAVDAELQRMAGLAERDGRTDELRQVVWAGLATVVSDLLEEGAFDGWMEAVQAFEPEGVEVDAETMVAWTEWMNVLDEGAAYRAWRLPATASYTIYCGPVGVDVVAVLREHLQVDDVAPDWDRLEAVAPDGAGSMVVHRTVWTEPGDEVSQIVLGTHTAMSAGAGVTADAVDRVLDLVTECDTVLGVVVTGDESACGDAIRALATATEGMFLGERGMYAADGWLLVGIGQQDSPAEVDVEEGDTLGSFFMLEWTDRVLLPMVREALPRAFADLVGDRDPADVAALAITTDPTALLPAAAACTRDHLASLQQTAADPDHHRWTPDAWDLGDVTGRLPVPEALAPVAAELARVADLVERGVTGDEPWVFRLLARATVVIGWQQLVDEGELAALDHALRVFRSQDPHPEVDAGVRRLWVLHLVPPADRVRVAAHVDVDIEGYGDDDVDLDLWAADFAARLGPMVRTAIDELVGHLPPEEVVAFGLYTDSDGRTLVSAACTRDHLARLQAEHPEHATYYRWATNEWDLLDLDIDGDALRPAWEELARNADLGHREDDEDDRAFQDFRRRVPEILVAVLADLVADGAFAGLPSAVRVVEVTDDGTRPETVLRWMRAINPPEAVAELERYLREVSDEWDADVDAWADDLVRLAKPAIRAALLAVVGDTPPTEVAALGLFATSDAASVNAGLLTKAQLERSGADRWSPSTSAWDRDLTDVEAGDQLDAVVDEIERAREVFDFSEVVHLSRASLVDAMGELFDEGFFDPYVDAVQVFEVVDAGVDPATRQAWAAAINTDEAAAEHARYLADED